MTRSASSSVHGSTRLAIRLVAGRRTLDELLVREAGGDDLARDRVRQRDVGADVEPEPQVGPLRRRRAPRVDDHQLRALCTAFSTWWKKIGCASRAFEPQRTIRSASRSLLVGARTAACTEHRRQTDDAGRVSGSVTAVDVVGVQGDPGELLRGVVQLVRGLRAAEEARLPSPRRAPCGSRRRRGRAPRPSSRPSALRRHEQAAGSAASYRGDMAMTLEQPAWKQVASHSASRSSGGGARPRRCRPTRGRVRRLLRAQVGASGDERLEQRRIVDAPGASTSGASEPYRWSRWCASRGSSSTGHAMRSRPGAPGQRPRPLRSRSRTPS